MLINWRDFTHAYFSQSFALQGGIPVLVVYGLHATQCKTSLPAVAVR